MTVPRPKFARVLPLFRRLAWRAAGAALVLAVVLNLLSVRVQAQPGDAPPVGVIISVNGNERRKMSTGKKIKRIAVSDPTRVNVVPSTPEEAIIVGVAPGIARVTLTDENDKQESFDVVIVQFDIRQLEQVLRQGAPTANIRPIPAGNNAVILRGVVDRAEDVQVVLQAAQGVVGAVQIINNIRVGGVQQVQLDVVVAQVQRSEFRSMALDFLGVIENTVFTNTTGGTVVPGLASVLAVGGPNTATLTPVFGPNVPNLTLGVINPASGIQFFLQALRTEGLLKLIAEPRLVTQSGRQASFLSGGEQAIPVPAGLGQIGVQFEEFGTRLNFLPIVLGNGKIHLEVEPEVSDLSAANGTSIAGTVVPGRTTQRVRTTVEIESGQTFVIGGLIQHSVNAGTTKVPVLGDIPFLGTFFSSKSFSEIETELVILVTPHLVDPMDCSQYPQCLPGQETRSPDDFELFLEGILEAPRGPRDVCPGNIYVPAYRNGPTAALFPCAGDNGHGHGHGHAGHPWLNGGVGGKGFCFGGNCPTCPGGTAVEVTKTSTGEVKGEMSKKVDANPTPSMPIREVSPMQPEVIKVQPASNPATSAPAALPSIFEIPMGPMP